MTHRFLHVNIVFANVMFQTDPQVLEPEFRRLSTDWMRLSQGTWILWTTKSPVTVSEMIRDKIGPMDQLFVGALDRSIPVAGWLPQWAWDWLNRQRDATSGMAFGPAPVYVPPPPPPPTNLLSMFSPPPPKEP